MITAEPKKKAEPKKSPPKEEPKPVEEEVRKHPIVVMSSLSQSYYAFICLHIGLLVYCTYNVK